VTGRRAALIAICGIIAVVSLGISVQAARYAHGVSARGPSAAEKSQAATTAIGQRWERLPVRQIFPAKVSYTTSVGTTETATQLGVGNDDS
jgi:hypothetical protein